MLLGYALAFIGIGLFIQGWSQIHKARGENGLVTVGLYAYVRHPQYTGLLIFPSDIFMNCPTKHNKDNDAISE
ncbi:isoprenylcysteine carboxylmethyltransferase family protein [uncultured Halopseudomonas sp.]|uniref:methyltransferase family protein n=1 Tax=uncultured Halopseudomonas sp. TaxID=2901193 RepID=UPI0030EC3E69